MVVARPVVTFLIPAGQVLSAGVDCSEGYLGRIQMLPSAAFAYDYTADMLQECERAGLQQKGMYGDPLCEIVSVEPLTKAQALSRGLQYRAVSWGKKFPADEDGYYIASSGEFIPKSWGLASPDGAFHRCTYPLNQYWSGPPDNQMKVLPHNGTADGKPPTRCFWRP
jgi:hypothetical protein